MITFLLVICVFLSGISIYYYYVIQDLQRENKQLKKRNGNSTRVKR
ncbi:hypothetical protein [Candidatus Liberibacter americanus]|nr:hypothetical protein [Candidatus Liberibacter americanus]